MERAVTSLLKQIVCFYRRYLSPYLGPRCRYYPSCSQYALICLDHYPLKKAITKTTVRIMKCNPLFPGGEDLP